ncbi:MAG TPA: glycosyltransferase family 39 protein [Planctomycetota bacterium]
MWSRALILLVVTLVGCWPTWRLPDWDGTEGRRVQIATEMANSGDWLVPTLGGQPTWAKPPLHYWILGALVRCFGESFVLLRLPSVLAACAAALLAGELLRRYFGARAGWVAALGIACSPMVLLEWPTAEIDPMFASLTAASLWCLATGVARERRGLVVAAGLLGGLAVLDKGPPYLLFAAGAWLVWWRRRGMQFSVAYFVPLALVPLAYFVPLWALRIAPGEMLAVANEESVGRIVMFEWSHVTSIPGFWLRAALVPAPFVFWCFWEWRGARDARMDAGDLMLRMCSGATVVAVALLTFFPGRPTRYLLPNVLLFVFAVTPAVAHFAAHRGELPLFARRSLLVVGVLGAVALVVLPFVPRMGIGALGLALVFALAPQVVRTPMHLVSFCLVVPLVASWTVGLERSLGWRDGPRSRAEGGRLLREELVERSAIDDLGTHGHFDSSLLLQSGLLPRGDESERTPPSSRWLLLEPLGAGKGPPSNYVERLRLCLPFKSFSLRERVAR